MATVNLIEKSPKVTRLYRSATMSIIRFETLQKITFTFPLFNIFHYSNNGVHQQINVE